MKFKTWEEMYDYLANGRDLYNVRLKKYVFIYNDDGALCAYHIDADEARKIATDALMDDESWSAYLGAGGAIMDDDSWNRDSYKDKYLARSYDFCKAHFEDEGWCDTKDYITM